ATAAVSAAARAGQSPVGRVRHEAEPRGAQPVGAVVRAASLPDEPGLPQRDLADPAAPQPDPLADPRGVGPARRGAAGRGCRGVFHGPRPDRRVPVRRLIAAGRAWDRFFFTPADPTPLALVRIATGLLLLWSLGVTGLDLRGFLGSDGWADPEVARALGGAWDWS